VETVTVAELFEGESATLVPCACEFRRRRAHDQSGDLGVQFDRPCKAHRTYPTESRLPPDTACVVDSFLHALRRDSSECG